MVHTNNVAGAPSGYRMERMGLRVLFVQDKPYGTRSLPPALQLFCEGKLPSSADAQHRQIMSALFVPYIQAMKLREVEDLARQPESTWYELFLGLTPAAAVSNIKAAGIPLPREVAAAVIDRMKEGGEELAEADEEAFKRDVLSLQVGAERVRDREAVCGVLVATTDSAWHA